MGWYRRSKLTLDAFRNLSSKTLPKTPIQQPVSRITRFNPYSIGVLGISTMGWYRRSKFTLEAFRNFSSKIVPKTPIQQPVSRITRFNPYSIGVLGISTMGLYRRSKFTLQAFRNFSSSKTVPKTPIQRPVSRITRFNPYSISVLGISTMGWYRRSKFTLEAFRNFSSKIVRFPRWIKDPRVVFMMVVTGAGIVVCVYYGSYETIPYTKRNHFVILTKSYERESGEKQFEEMKASFKNRVLPAKHPESIRVRSIATNIIEALQRGLNKEQTGDYGTLEALSENSEGGGVSKEDEIHDDQCVEQSRKKGAHYATGHLEGVKWEVLVVDKPVVNALCLPGGKIVVFTGLLKHFRTDSEIAAIIGHEVGHVVARHSADRMTKFFLFTILQLILCQGVPDAPEVLIKVTNFLLLPFSRRHELEADYIGLLLMASAGYDPQVAPSVFRKLDEVDGDSSLMDDYLSTHPSGKKRAKLLAKAKVMEEALAIYRESMALAGERGGFNSSV